MDLEKQLSEKEEELKTLACELSDLLKDFSQKQQLLDQVQKSIPALEKKLKRKTEMLQQEKNDNEIIIEQIASLQREKDANAHK